MTQAASQPNPKWTAAQRQAIETVGASLLVSAAAGSGKTAVLAERCAYLVCEAKEPCDVDELLVVTFTDSAAAEMKSRIRQAIRQRKGHSDHARRQAELVDHARVSTIHSFCRRLLRQHFHLVGIDPNFRLLDADEATLLRSEVAADLLQLRYESDATGDFQRLIDDYGDGNDQRLMDQVIATHQMLCSLLDPGAWRQRAIQIIDESFNQPLEKSKLGRAFLQLVSQRLIDLLRRCDEIAVSIGAMGPALAKYMNYLADFRKNIVHFQNVLSKDGFDMLVSEARDLPREALKLPSIKNDAPRKQSANPLVGDLKDDFFSLCDDLLHLDSAQWKTGMSQVAAPARAFFALVEDFERQYTQAKRAADALDFSDLERLSLAVLREGNFEPPKPSAAARSLHRQIRYVLVDEYQDINEIQDAILTLVSHECVADANQANLFCVGDVKQSIFRFRLADPNLFLSREDRITKGKDPSSGRLIHLQENFRSRGPMLEAINSIFERLMVGGDLEIRYDQSHRLKSGKTFPNPGAAATFTGAPIELHLLPPPPRAGHGDDAEPEFERSEAEAALAAQRIKELMGLAGSPIRQVVKTDALGNAIYKPLEFGDIVILLRAMQHKADAFADVLRANGIPVHSESGVGFFAATEIRDILALLQILDNQRQDIPLAAVLRSPLANLPNAEDCLAAIRIAYGDETVPFHEAVRKYSIEQDDELAAKLRDLFSQLEDWRDASNKRPVAELIGQIYDQTAYVAFCSGLADGRQRAANLEHLLERAAQFGSFLRQGLHRFLQFLDRLSEERDLPRPTTAADAQHVVRIMSIHRAKGLEFPVVILPDLGKRHNLQDAQGSIVVDRGKHLGMEVADESRLIRYPSISSILVKDALTKQTFAEELRLLYVAMTRAKEHLILIGTASAKARERWQNLYGHRASPLTADEILAGHAYLDWLGPIAAMTGVGKTAVFDVHAYDEARLRELENPRLHQPAMNELQLKMARMERLDPPAPTTETSAKLTARFEKTYPFARFTHQAAVTSVTSQSKTTAGGRLEPDEPTDRRVPMQRKLDLPNFFAAAAPAKATDIGTATHLVLQYWDFAASAGDDGAIDRHIHALVDRKMISREQAQLVDRNAIAWFFSSELCSQLRAGHTAIRREVPFALTRDPDDAGGAVVDDWDKIMIRGRIDLLLPDPNGVTVVDYKTDGITADQIAARSELYSMQMSLYRQAVERLSNQKVNRICLVFLTARQIVEL